MKLKNQIEKMKTWNLKEWIIALATGYLGLSLVSGFIVLMVFLKLFHAWESQQNNYSQESQRWHQMDVQKDKDMLETQKFWDLVQDNAALDDDPKATEEEKDRARLKLYEQLYQNTLDSIDFNKQDIKNMSASGFDKDLAAVHIEQDEYNLSRDEKDLQDLKKMIEELKQNIQQEKTMSQMKNEQSKEIT